MNLERVLLAFPREKLKGRKKAQDLERMKERCLEKVWWVVQKEMLKATMMAENLEALKA